MYLRSLGKTLSSFQIIMTAPDAPAFIQTHVGIGYRMLKVE